MTCLYAKVIYIVLECDWMLGYISNQNVVVIGEAIELITFS